MIPIPDAVAFVEKDVSGRTPAVGVYWYECKGDRQAVSAEFRAAGRSACLIALNPRRGFDNANALPSDLVALLQEHREVIEDVVAAAGRERKPIGVILVSRTRLEEPLIGSPVRLPDWFPYCGGDVVTIDILDVASVAASTLQSQAETIGKVQVLLYEIEGLMLSRLREVLTRNHNATHKLFGEILKPDQKSANFLSAAEERHRLSSPEGFRAVSSPTSNHLLGRIVGIVGDRSPNQLPSLGRALFAALEVPEHRAVEIREPLFGVALRSTNKDWESNKAIRSVRNVLLSLYVGAQLVTAQAHAGEYGEFEVVVMRSMLLDCVAVLEEFKSILM